jgi:hypothetical protein
VAQESESESEAAMSMGPGREGYCHTHRLHRKPCALCASTSTTTPDSPLTVEVEGHSAVLVSGPYGATAESLYTALHTPGRDYIHDDDRTTDIGLIAEVLRAYGDYRAQAAAKAERERCAKVAEAERVFVSAPGHPSAPERIAAAIRGEAK